MRRRRIATDVRPREGRRRDGRHEPSLRLRERPAASPGPRRAHDVRPVRRGGEAFGRKRKRDPKRPARRPREAAAGVQAVLDIAFARDRGAQLPPYGASRGAARVDAAASAGDATMRSAGDGASRRRTRRARRRQAKVNRPKVPYMFPTATERGCMNAHLRAVARVQVARFKGSRYVATLVQGIHTKVVHVRATDKTVAKYAFRMNGLPRRSRHPLVRASLPPQLARRTSFPEGSSE